MPAEVVDSVRMRLIMGRFATGVAVVTSVDRSGRPQGFTSNAIASVSVEPPLLLVCVGRQVRTLGAITASKAFAVNLLAAGGEELSRRFAGTGEDKFRGVRHRPSDRASGAPVLYADSVATVECVAVDFLDVADHVLVIGAPQAGAVYDRPALVYLQREYGSWRPGPPRAPRP
ncbi:flavin reductase family protein [Streptomonospora nanhaiensis]|uniref:flavin reductase family protein n=1 Tax=Streptomonospora nanhaiensis TaxID=1323731 RepID=UPI001C3805CB|nr:flavin reductase family protein [Streptomonospora nanhaiensis]MBV2365246.1 flavin reductase family protein [Streptomonospora nanhaiensis]